MAKKQDTKSPIVKFVHLYSWESPVRYWRPRSRAWFVWYAFCFVVLIFLSALTEQYFLILALIALLTMLYAQAAVPPHYEVFEITNRGLKAFDNLYRWKDIEHFWVTEKVAGGLMKNFNGQHETYRQINFDLPHKIPSRLSLLLDGADEEMVVFTLLEYIPYAEPTDTSDDIVAKVIYGTHIELKEYSGEQEIFPETEEFPELEIETDPEKEQQKQLKREKQLEELHKKKSK